MCLNQNAVKHHCLKKAINVTNNTASCKQDLLNVIAIVEAHLLEINALFKQRPHDEQVMCAYRYYAHIHTQLKKQYQSQYGNDMTR